MGNMKITIYLGLNNKNQFISKSSQPVIVRGKFIVLKAHIIRVEIKY